MVISLCLFKTAMLPMTWLPIFFSLLWSNHHINLSIILFSSCFSNALTSIFIKFLFLLLYTYEKSISISYYIKKNYILIYEHKIIIITSLLYFLSIFFYNILFWIEYLLLVFWDCQLIFFNFYNFNLLRATFPFCWFVKYLSYWKHF